jgi:predicted RNA-binding Zn-ribbon protein involved in translation (DUF1610 family)
VSEAKAFVAETTADGRLVYLSAAARPAQPGLEQALTELLHELARRSYSELHGDRVRFDALRALRGMGFAVEDVEIAVSYRCPQCGASIQLNPEAVVYVCPYCGWAGDVRGGRVAVRVWPAGHRGLVEELARKLGGEPVSVELLYVPFWVFEASVEAGYSATVVYRKPRPVRAYGRSPYYETRYVRERVRVSGRVRFRAARAVPARLHAEVFGGEELRLWVERKWSFQQPPILEAEEAKPIAPSMLAPELSAEAAAEAAVDELEDAAADEARRDAGRRAPGYVEEVELERFSPSVSVERRELVFAPYWFFTYRKGLGLYSGAAVGSEATPLRVELPLSTAERAARLAGSWLAAAASGLAAELALRWQVEPLALLLAVGLGLLAAAKLVSSAFAPAKVG